MHSVNIDPIWLGKVSKDAEFSEVMHSTFRSANFLKVYREIAENRFPGKFRKFKFLHFDPFYDCFRGKKGPWFRIFSFPDIRNYRMAGIYRIFTGKFRLIRISFLRFRRKYWIYREIPGKFFFCVTVNSISRSPVFEIADSEFYGCRLIRIIVFSITAKIPNLPNN